ncbi:MAG: metallophosphoesterase [Polyangiaceae bacterium]
MTAIAYITDVEGRWSKLATFADQNPYVTLEGERFEVAPGAVSVFGGDAIDRGPEGRKVLRALLDVKRRQPDQVVLLAGNRDINKMRMPREMNGFPPSRTPPEERAAGGSVLLKWILFNTMGAREAFAHRKTELTAESGPCDDEDVVRSFLDDVAPGGLLRSYLAHCQLAYRAEQTLFVHGGVTSENFGRVPNGVVVPSVGPAMEAWVSTSVDEWVARLNEFFRSQIQAFDDNRYTEAGTPAWASIVAYQAPLFGSRLNQQSVVYARPTDAVGNPSLPDRALVEALRLNGIDRVVVGHTPAGDCPSVLRSDGFELILADNSYGRVEPGSRVVLRGEETCVEGQSRLDDGADEQVRFKLPLRENGPIGLRDVATGQLVKGRLSCGDYLMFRWSEPLKVEQLRATPSEVSRRTLAAPWLASDGGTPDE